MSLPLSPPSDEAGISSRRRTWLNRIPWGTLAVLAGSGTYLAFFYRMPPSTPDEGMIAAGAERILRGQIPFRDFFSELGPGSYYLQAIIFHFAGISVSAFRLTAWTLGALLSGLIYSLGKKVIRGPAVFAPPFIFATTCYTFVYYVSHHWWGDFFFLLSVACLAAFTLVANEGSSFSRQMLLFAAGLLAALTLLCMQPKGAWAVCIGVVFLILAEKLLEKPQPSTWRTGLGRIFWFLLGVGSTLGLAVGYFGSHGALGDWIYDNFTFLFANYLPYETLPGIYSWTRLSYVCRWVVHDLSFQTISYLVGYYFYALVGPVIGFAGAAWQIKRERKGDPRRSRLLLLFLLAGVGSLFSELHEPNVLHLIWASPLILILFVDAGNEALRHRGWWQGPLTVAAALSCALVMVVASRRVVRVAGRNAPAQTRRGTIFLEPGSATIYQKWVDVIERAVPAGGDTFIFPYDAQFYFLTATRNPTRYDVLIPGFNGPRQFEEAILSLEKRHPPFIFSFANAVRWSPRAHYPDDLPDLPAPDPTEKSLQSAPSSYQKGADVEEMEVWTLKK
jgi:hypothetical protein